MLFDATFQKYLAQRPVAVMTRATLEHVFAAPTLDAIFEQTAQQQYTEELTFSTVVAVLQAVVFQQQPSVRSAYLHGAIDIPVSLSPKSHGRKQKTSGRPRVTQSRWNCERATMVW